MNDLLALIRDALKGDARADDVEVTESEVLVEFDGEPYAITAEAI